jgi:hypothetical protein
MFWECQSGKPGLSTHKVRAYPRVLTAAIASLFLFGCSGGNHSDNEVQKPVAGYLTVANAAASAATCSVNASGEITDCEVNRNDALTVPGSVDAASGRVWFSNLDSNSIAACKLENGVPSACASLPQNVMKSPLGVAVSRNTLYVTNADNTISVCTLDTAGTPGNCKTDNAAGTLSNPMNLVAKNNLLLVTNQNSNSISVCRIGSDGALSNCRTQDGNGTFNLPAGIAMTDSALYVTNVGDDSITGCQLSSDGSIGACVKMSDPANLDKPMDIAINGSVAYVTNFGTQSLAQCVLSANGSIGHCQVGSSADTLQFPSGIVFTPVAH